jgi:hypothetical protein
MDKKHINDLIVTLGAKPFGKWLKKFNLDLKKELEDPKVRELILRNIEITKNWVNDFEDLLKDYTEVAGAEPK